MHEYKANECVSTETNVYTTTLLLLKNNFSLIERFNLWFTAGAMSSCSPGVLTVIGKERKTNKQTFLLFPRFVFDVCSQPVFALALVFANHLPPCCWFVIPLFAAARRLGTPPQYSPSLQWLQLEVCAASAHVRLLYGRAKGLYVRRRQLAAPVFLKNGNRKKIKGAFPLACAPFFPRAGSCSDASCLP